ncbi:hypothetical protein SB761_27415, partial [Pseudomonas sp. SIMBA_064]
FAAVTACGKSEPNYSGISVMGRNYLPYNMNGFIIADAYGNKASGGGDDGQWQGAGWVGGAVEGELGAVQGLRLSGRASSQASQLPRSTAFQSWNSVTVGAGLPAITVS